MAHEIVFDTERKINPIAFVGEVPWHGLGQQLTPNSPLEVWAQEAGMDWKIKNSAALYMDDELLLRAYPGRQMLHRSDNQAPLSIVSDGYKIVQPLEVLEFFRSLIDEAGFKMNTAGVLFGGTKFWALAETNESARIMGQDKLDQYLLLATSCDTSLATTGMFTTVRTVCNNTLQMAIGEGEAGWAKKYIKIPHSVNFDPELVKQELGLAPQSMAAFVEKANVLARRKVNSKEALEWLIRVFGNVQDGQEITDEIIGAQENARTIKSVYELFHGRGKGSQLVSANGTAWGLVNAATEYLDHQRTMRTVDSRLDSTWFGDGATLKDKAWNQALKLAA